MRVFLCLLLSLGSFIAQAQSNIISVNPLAGQIMKGNYDPALYMPSVVLNHPDTISRGILAAVSPDSLHKYLLEMSAFGTRNTGSDTVSSTKGIGAARRWAYSKFEQFSAQSQNRLIPSYLQFDLNVCGIFQHRNIFAVLPGADTSDKSIVLVEAHFDTRCAGLCDTACLAEGMEDNGSGSALVLELARVMSRYTFNHTIVFVLTIGEEQSLVGADAFSDYIQQQGIAVKAVLNNDVIGGVICGQTSSPPSCPGLNQIDSTQVRLFSQGSFNSPHKGLSRFIKLEYKEMILPFVSVPMAVTIMNDEDRIGRGGDHIPFRQKGYAAMRFTSANENGDANVSAAGYADRQHTSTDILGVDTDNDTIIDSFFVDFNYLARNAVINGNAIGMMGIGPKTPDFWLTSSSTTDMTINITQQQQYLHYRIGVRNLTNDWDSVYTFTGSLTHTLTVTPGTYIVSVASVDGNGVESLFSRELRVTTGINDITSKEPQQPVELLQNRPNPFDETTTISVFVNKTVSYRNAFISVRDLNGKEIKRLKINLEKGMNEVVYEHGYGTVGTYVYTLIIDGKAIDSRSMVFAN